MQKTKLFLIVATCLFLIHLHFTQSIGAEDVSGDPGSNQLTGAPVGSGTPTGNPPLGTLSGDTPTGGGIPSGFPSGKRTKRDGPMPSGVPSGFGDTISSGTPGGTVVFDPSSEKFALEKRVSVLESTKQDLTLWITIFVTMVTILIALNVGLSVWQVGGIARREVELRIKEFDDQFNGILSKDAQTIDEQIKAYESKLLALGEKLENCDTISTKKLSQMDETLAAFRNEADAIRSKFLTDSENLKENTLTEIENYYLKKIQDLDSKLQRKRGSDEGS